MKLAVPEIVVGNRQEIFKEVFQVNRCRTDAFGIVVIVGTHQRVAEIPGVLREDLIAYRETEGLQVFDDKHGRRAGIPLAEGVDLPYPGGEGRDMTDCFRERDSGVGELFFRLKIIVHGRTDALPRSIGDGLAAENPFLLGDVVCSELTGVIQQAGKQALMNSLPGSR